MAAQIEKFVEVFKFMYGHRSDGSEPFSASRFFVTIASPFLVGLVLSCKQESAFR